MPGSFWNFLTRFLMVYFASLVLGYRERSKQLETDKKNAELSALRSQINPHFLFNTLNGIYGQAISRSDQTAPSISRLSSIMRYVLTETAEDKVSLDREIEYINNFIHLQKIRLTEKTTVNFDVDGDTASISIPPLLFINLIENAFKYGVSTEKESTIKIRISAKQGSVAVLIRNDKISGGKIDARLSHTGIENTRRRLDLLYGKNYSLEILEDEHQFSTNLKIYGS
jgi:sensor histidine kinase YesM